MYRPMRFCIKIYIYYKIIIIINLIKLVYLFWHLGMTTVF